MNVGIPEGLINGHRTGIGNYTLQMLLALRADDPKLRFLSAHLTGWREVKISEDRSHGSSSKRGRQLRQLVGALPAVRSAYRLSQHLAHRVTYQSRAISIFHAFNFLPVTKPLAPTLPVVYDLSFIHYPEMHPPERIKWLKKLPSVVQSAARVHTISEFSKNEIAETFSYPRERIFVAYPAAARHFHRKGKCARSFQLTRLTLEWKRYFLAVGTLEPRKNLQTLLAAYANLPSQVQVRCPLVIAGGYGWGDQRLTPAAERLTRSGLIRFLGYVSEEDLSGLYEGAKAMFYPSIYEGFGMPVVEAMACGTAAVHSSNTSMDEIGGGLLARADALDVDAWTICMLEADRREEDADRTSRLVTRARTFDALNSAKIIRRAYDQILGRL